MRPAQSLAVKRAEVEFHKFASLGEPERVLRVYAEENARRRGLLAKHLDFIGPVSPFLEIGANAGHTSYMLANEFGADGFALDLSADALRYGTALQDAWKLTRVPVRLAGDVMNLPFRDGSIRLVAAFQMLYQFTDLEAVFTEVKRVLAPGGIFFFAEEPLRRILSLRLYRCRFYEAMTPLERRLHDWGLLGFLVKDVIGAAQEREFGIAQNYGMDLKQWRALIQRHFTDHRCEVFVPQRGWAESAVKRLAVRLDRYRSVWTAGRLLGGTFAAVCRKAGNEVPEFRADRFEQALRCPDCHGALGRGADDALTCGCGYQAANEGGVYNLLRSSERKELYPGDREDLIDFSSPGHEKRLGGGWHRVEGVFGNRYRWLDRRATARLERCSAGPQRLRIRGHAPQACFEQGQPVRIEVLANGAMLNRWTLERTGLFVLEAELPDAPVYSIEIQASPAWQSPPDGRTLTVTVSMIRLVVDESFANSAPPACVIE